MAVHSPLSTNRVGGPNAASAHKEIIAHGKESQRHHQAADRGGKANPAPPIGPALAGYGINIMAFCKEYNARTSNRPARGDPAEITVYSDGSFTFVLKTSPRACCCARRPR